MSIFEELQGEALRLVAAQHAAQDAAKAAAQSELAALKEIALPRFREICDFLQEQEAGAKQTGYSVVISESESDQPVELRADFWVRRLTVVSDRDVGVRVTVKADARVHAAQYSRPRNGGASIEVTPHNRADLGHVSNDNILPRLKLWLKEVLRPGFSNPV